MTATKACQASRFIDLIVYMILIHNAVRCGTCWRGITQIKLPPTRLSTAEMSQVFKFPAAEHHHTLAGKKLHYSVRKDFLIKGAPGRLRFR